jgi:hypothetical protein
MDTATCPCGAPMAHDGVSDSWRHSKWLRGEWLADPQPAAPAPPPTTLGSEPAPGDSPGWHDLNGLQKGMALLMSAVTLAIVIPLLVLLAAGIVNLWEWVF